MDSFGIHIVREGQPVPVFRDGASRRISGCPHVCFWGVDYLKLRLGVISGTEPMPKKRTKRWAMLCLPQGADLAAGEIISLVVGTKDGS